MNEFEKQLNLILEKILKKSNSFIITNIKKINLLMKEIFALDESFISTEKKILALRKIKKELFTLIASLDKEVFASFGRDLKQIFLTTNKITKQFLKGLKNSDEKFYKKRLSDVSNTFIKAFESIQSNINTFIDLKEKIISGKATKTEIKIFNKLDEKFKEGKFIRIKNKRNKEMFFRLNTYIELVNRTNFGNMQTDTAISTSNANGITTFTITSHNTKTEICKVHEGKTYTTDEKLKIFPFLTAERRPLYHINCQHRLVPKPFTQKQLQRLTRNRVD